jgi:hypothetical protein
MHETELETKKVIDSPLKIILICVCALFTFGGAVNQGLSGFIFAIPFLLLWIILIFNSGKKIVIISLIVLLLILILYVLRVKESAIFFPANGKEIVLNQDACFTYSEDGKTMYPPRDWVGYDSFKHCREEASIVNGIKNSKIVSKGTKYIINSTYVSHQDMGENYIASVSNGEDSFNISDSQLFEFNDGTKFSQNHLRQPYFYYPSMLMIWGVLPTVIYFSVAANF